MGRNLFASDPIVRNGDLDCVGGGSDGIVTNDSRMVRRDGLEVGGRRKYSIEEAATPHLNETPNRATSVTNALDLQIAILTIVSLLVSAKQYTNSPKPQFRFPPCAARRPKSSYRSIKIFYEFHGAKTHSNASIPPTYLSCNFRHASCRTSGCRHYIYEPCWVSI